MTNRDRHPATIGPWAEYERRKRAWLRAHPDATHQQVEQALRRIARALGL